MRSDSLNRILRLEVLDNREAPAVLVVTPPAADAPTPPAATVADQGCDNGITPHADANSNGVVKCS